MRKQVHGLIQDVLDQEVTEFLGRAKSVRLGESEGAAGYRNGYGKVRRLTTSVGTIEVRRPRVRDTEERLVSRVMPLLRRRAKDVDDLLPDLYLHGLAEGDFDLAMRGLLGEDAPISAASVARLKTRWDAEQTEWRTRDLSDLEPVCMWADGFYVKAGLEKDKAALLTAIVGLSEGSKQVLGIYPGCRESRESWSAMLRDLRDRGLRCPKLVIGDGNLGLWGGLENVFPEAAEQRVLKSQDHQRGGPSAQGPAGEGEADAAGHPQRRDP